MRTDKSNGRLDQIKSFAKENNMLESFCATFSRLETYSNKGYIITRLETMNPVMLILKSPKN